MKYLIVGTGGFFGAIARYAISSWIAARLGIRFPLGTLTVNVTGSFFLALFITLMLERLMAGAGWRLFWAVGFLGAYTTFSTFAWETDALVREGLHYMAIANVLANVAAGLLAARLGLFIARAIG